MTILVQQWIERRHAIQREGSAVSRGSDWQFISSPAEDATHYFRLLGDPYIWALGCSLPMHTAVG